MRDHAQAVQDAREAVLRVATRIVERVGVRYVDEFVSFVGHCDSDLLVELDAAVRHLATVTATEGARDA